MIPPAIAALAEVGAIEGTTLRAATTAGAEGEGLMQQIMDMQIPLPIRKSSCVASASYRVRTGLLIITFHHGETVEYPDTQIATVVGLVSAKSPGTFYNTVIKGRA